jgi:hypothetical protein
MYDEVYDRNGNLVSQTVRQQPVRVVSDADLAQVKTTIKNMMQTFYPGGTPTGTPTNTQLRNWLIAVSTGLRYLYNELDTD